ncbi:MAG: hypothetical protein ACOZNI_18540, partial [Myxococcota bacterium]
MKLLRTLGLAAILATGMVATRTPLALSGEHDVDAWQDDDAGHGNDPDGYDEDNPGESRDDDDWDDDDDDDWDDD